MDDTNRGQIKLRANWKHLNNNPLSLSQVRIYFNLLHVRLRFVFFVTSQIPVVDTPRSVGIRSIFVNEQRACFSR